MSTDQLGVELDVLVHDLTVLRDFRRFDLLLLTAVVEFSREVVVEVVTGLPLGGLPPGGPPPDMTGLLLLLDYLLVHCFQ